MMALPTGRPGRLLALLLVLLAAALLWFGLAAPLAGWYAARDEQLGEQRAVLARMQALAATLPALRQAAAARGQTAPPASVLLAGATDAAAGAALAEQLQTMAASAGTAFSSVETLPPAAAGAQRRIGLRVALLAPFPALVGLLAAIETAHPRMLIDELQLRPAHPLPAPPDPPIEARFTVFAFRAGS